MIEHHEVVGHYLDLVPRGRDEEGRPNQYWLRRRDEYGS